LYRWENLGGFEIFFLKNPENLNNFQKKEGFDPKNPSLNTPLDKDILPCLVKIASNYLIIQIC